MRFSTRKGAVRSHGRISTAFSMLVVLALLTFTLLSAPATAMGVVAFDYGTEWMKVSLVKPGLPFDVVLDRDSKRKIQSAVSFKKWAMDEEILFGTNAYNHATREPKQSFYGLKTLLGRTTAEEDKAYVDLYTSIFGNDVVSSDRGTCSLKRPTSRSEIVFAAVLTVEELVGMQLEYAKKLAEETAGERVNPSLPSGFSVGVFGGLDAVVTVPAFFTAQERQSIVDAAILAASALDSCRTVPRLPSTMLRHVLLPSRKSISSSMWLGFGAGDGGRVQH